MKLYDIHIKYENGDEYSKYGLKEKDLKYHRFVYLSSYFV